MKKQIIVCILWLCCVSVSAYAATDKALFDKGVASLKTEKFQDAVEAFSQLILQAPDNPDAYKNRGVAYMKLGQYDSAISDFEKTRDIKPDMKGLYSNLGVAWYYKGEFEQAIKNYNMEIAMTPDNYYAYFNRAICWSELGKLSNALKDVDRSVELSQDFYLAQCLRGDLLVKLGKIDSARKAYEKAVAINPEMPYARDQLAGLPEQTKNGDAAQPAKNTVKKSVPQDVKEVEPSPKTKPDTANPAQKPVEEKPKEPAVTPKTPPEQPQASDTGTLELQAGAYHSKENALDMEKKLTQGGYPARIIEMTRPTGKPWFLVRTGKFDTRTAAETAQKEAMQKLGTDIIIRPYGKF